MAGLEFTAITDIPATSELQPTDVPDNSTTAQNISTEQSITTVIPGDISTLTTFPNNTISPHLNTTTQDTDPTTDSETPEYPETPPATSASLALTTTEFTRPDTAVSQITDTTTSPVTLQMSTTHHSPNTTIASDANTTTPHTNTTIYPTTVSNITTSSTPTTIPSANTTHYISPTIPITDASTTTSTISPTTVTPPTTTALKCENGGENVNGVCICPDEWTGKTCSESKVY